MFLFFFKMGEIIACLCTDQFIQGREKTLIATEWNSWKDYFEPWRRHGTQCTWGGVGFKQKHDYFIPGCQWKIQNVVSGTSNSRYVCGGKCSNFFPIGSASSMIRKWIHQCHDYGNLNIKSLNSGENMKHPFKRLSQVGDFVMIIKHH